MKKFSNILIKESYKSPLIEEYIKESNKLDRFTPKFIKAIRQLLDNVFEIEGDIIDMTKLKDKNLYITYGKNSLDIIKIFKKGEDIILFGDIMGEIDSIEENVHVNMINLNLSELYILYQHLIYEGFLDYISRGMIKKINRM